MPLSARNVALSEWLGTVTSLAVSPVPPLPAAAQLLRSPAPGPQRSATWSWALPQADPQRAADYIRTAWPLAGWAVSAPEADRAEVAGTLSNGWMTGTYWVDPADEGVTLRLYLNAE